MSPDALQLGGIDHAKEEKIARKRKREEAFQRLQSKEKERVASQMRPQDLTESKSENRNTDNESDDDNDDDNDDDYHPGSHGHVRKRARIVSLDFDVDELRSSFSAVSDHRTMSSYARSDHLSNFVVKGGGDLYDVPSSQRSMVRYEKQLLRF